MLLIQALTLSIPLVEQALIDSITQSQSLLNSAYILETALAASKKIWEEDGDERARDASYRYEAKLDAYNFLIGKFANYRAGKGFHDMPDGLFGERHY